MSILNQPTNLNLLSQTGFRFVLGRAPNVNYFCQSTNLPGISLDAVQQTTPFSMIQLGGTKLVHDPVEIRFKVDEDLANYLEIHDWMKSIAVPESYEQYDSAYRTDATLTVMSSHNNPNLQIKFRDIFPITLSGLQFQSDATDIEYLEATVTFKYTLYDINRI